MCNPKTGKCYCKDDHCGDKCHLKGDECKQCDVCDVGYEGENCDTCSTGYYSVGTTCKGKIKNSIKVSKSSKSTNC